MHIVPRAIFRDRSPASHILAACLLSIALTLAAGLPAGGLFGVGLSGAGLSGVGLSGVGLSGAGLSGAGLSGVGLSGDGPSPFEGLIGSSWLMSRGLAVEDGDIGKGQDPAAGRRDAFVAASSSEANSPVRSTASDRQTGEQSGQAKGPQRDKNGVLNITFDDIKLDMGPDDVYDESYLTEDVKELDGERVKVRGFMLPSSKQRGITAFILVRDNKECCYGPSAAIYDCVLVRLKKGTSTQFTVRPVTVEGKFFLKEYRPRKGLPPLAVYRMTDVVIK